jgi:hypothetical protein
MPVAVSTALEVVSTPEPGAKVLAAISKAPPFIQPNVNLEVPQKSSFLGVSFRHYHNLGQRLTPFCECCYLVDCS